MSFKNLIPEVQIMKNKVLHVSKKYRIKNKFSYYGYSRIGLIVFLDKPETEPIPEFLEKSGIIIELLSL